MGENDVPPALPGEVMRWTHERDVFFAVTRGYPLEGLFAWGWDGTNLDPPQWYLIQSEERRASILGVAFERERARAEQAEHDARLAATLTKTAQERERVALSDVAYYKDREATIIKALAPVSDGGQYRADIVSAIGRVLQDRSKLRADLAALVKKYDEACAKLDEYRALDRGRTT